MTYFKNALLIPCLIFICINVEAQEYTANWNSLDSRPIPDWFQDAKFGIFIHWGVYSVPAYRPLEEGLYASYSEWYYARVYQNELNGGKQFHEKNFGADFRYRDFAPMFRAELWQPEEWARIFKEAGAKYVVLTSKHHDGFCLWPTKSKYKKNWNSMDIGPHRDLVGDLTTAVKEEGLKMGLYYSIIEWESSRTHRTESGYYVPLKEVNEFKIPEDEYVDNHLIPQLKELVVNYKPSLIFADGGEWDGSEEYWKTLQFLSWLYNDSPVKDEVVVNDRFAKGMPGRHGDYYSSEYSDASLDDLHPWEESRGIGGSYGYNRAENLNNYNTSEELIHELIDIVSRGGNLLLNVGPTADGRIPVIMQQRLFDIGNWLAVNGEAIYNTRKTLSASALPGNDHIWFTEKENAIYAIFNAWPEDYIEINLSNDINVKKITMIGSGRSLIWNQNGKRLRIAAPVMNINQLPCLYSWVFKIETVK